MGDSARIAEEYLASKEAGCVIELRKERVVMAGRRFTFTGMQHDIDIRR
jgi:hypothetical protein